MYLSDSGLSVREAHRRVDSLYRCVILLNLHFSSPFSLFSFFLFLLVSHIHIGDINCLKSCYEHVLKLTPSGRCNLSWAIVFLHAFFRSRASYQTQ